MKKELDPEYVKSILYYNKETGELFWKYRYDVCKNWNPRWSGKLAGCKDAYGYITLGINKVRYYAHHIAWIINYGECPIMDIDHKNGDPSDNRISNLRLATRIENMRNCGITSRNKSGVKGVHWAKEIKKWTASIKVDGKNTYLGYFDKIEEARAAREAAEIKYFGEFRRAS